MKLTKGKLSKLYKKKNQSVKRKHGLHIESTFTPTTFRKRNHLNLSNKSLKGRKGNGKIKGGTSSPERNDVNAGDPLKTEKNEVTASLEIDGTSTSVYIVGVSQGQYAYQKTPGINEEKKEIDKNIIEIDDNGITNSLVSKEENRVKIEGVVSDVFGVAFGDTAISKYDYPVPLLKVNDRDYLQINGIFVEEEEKESKPWVFIATKLMSSSDATANGNFSYGYVRQDKIVIRGFYEQELIRLPRYNKTNLPTFEQQYKAFVGGLGKEVILYDKKKLLKKRTEIEVDDFLVTKSLTQEPKMAVSKEDVVKEEEPKEEVVKEEEPEKQSILPSVEIVEKKILPVEQTFSLFYNSIKDDLVKSIVSAIHVNPEESNSNSKDFSEGMTSLNKSNMINVYGGGTEDTDYDEKLRTFFKKVNENVEEKDKISNEDIERFIKDKDIITEKMSELAIEKPEIHTLLNAFVKSQDENLNSDLPPTVEGPVKETLPLEEETSPFPSSSNPANANIGFVPIKPVLANTFPETLALQETSTTPPFSFSSNPENANTGFVPTNPVVTNTFPETPTLQETSTTPPFSFSSNPENANTFPETNTQKKPTTFGSLNNFTQKTASFANKALDASAKTADVALKLHDISKSQHPMEGITIAESNGTIDPETANKMRKTYEGLEKAKQVYGVVSSKKGTKTKK